MHDKLKKMLATAAAVVVGFFGVVAMQSPAQATWSDCNAYSNVICFHQYPDFTGRVWRQLPGQIIACRNMWPDNFDNTASTVFNKTTKYILYVYDGEGCTGTRKSFVPGDVESFGDTSTWWNNRISSIYLQYVG